MSSRSQCMTTSSDAKRLSRAQKSKKRQEIRSRVVTEITRALLLLLYLAWLVPCAEAETANLIGEDTMPFGTSDSAATLAEESRDSTCRNSNGHDHDLASGEENDERDFFAAAVTTDAPTTTPGGSVAPSLSWITRSRLTHAQLDSLSLREGTSCPAVPYYRVVSLHDGPGAEVISIGRVVTPRAPVLLYGVPMYGSAGQSSFGRLYRKGHKLVVDAFAAEIFITVARSGTGNGAGIVAPTKDPKNGNSSSSAVVHHLSTLEITCRSTVFRVSCEARYIFTRPNTRLMEPTLVMIHPLEGRTTLPLNGISSVIASGLSSTAAVTLGSQIFEDLVNIEYLTMVLPADSYPCRRTEHWLRTIPAYVESAVLSGLASAVGGDTTSRSDLTPTVVAGRHLRIVKGPVVARTAVFAEDSPFSSSAGGSGSSSAAGTATTTTAPRATEPLSPAPPITAYTLYRYRINIEDTPPLSSNALQGVTWLLVAFIVVMLLSIAAMFISRRQYISSYRDTWTSPDGRRMIFGNTARPTPSSSSLINRGEEDDDSSVTDEESSSSTSNEGDAEDDAEDAEDESES